MSVYGLLRTQKGEQLMDWEGSATMPFVGDALYACACGCNSFFKHRQHPMYLCRGCGITHVSSSAGGKRRISPAGSAVRGGEA